jgi:hypothetical protein
MRDGVGHRNVACNHWKEELSFKYRFCKPELWAEICRLQQLDYLNGNLLTFA